LSQSRDGRRRHRAGTNSVGRCRSATDRAVSSAILDVSDHTISRWGSLLPTSNGMRIACIVLAVATCCGITQASAQFRAYVGPSVGGPGFGNPPAPGSAGLGTAGLGLGGFGSATQSLGLGDTSTGSTQGLSLPLLNQGSGKALGVTGNAAGSAQGSLSSAIDRPSSRLNSVTNSLMGPVSNAVSRAPNSATTPAGGKRKQNGNAAAAPSSDRSPAVASKVSPARNP
jgi:hypothetical protein